MIRLAPVRLLALLATSLTALGCGGAERNGSATPRELLPDLDQVAPDVVSVKRVGDRDLLVFVSAVENLGAGPIVLDARRDSPADPMPVVQEVERVDGSTATRPLHAFLRYVRAETHAHWHLEGFERYELRRIDGTIIGRDRKTGFCLGDRYERTTIELPRKPPEPVWEEECEKGEPDALHVRQGISPGYGDDYVPRLEGQSIDVTGLRPGRYLLVHVVNPDGTLAESDRGNNAASALVELSLKGGRLQVHVLRSCPETDECVQR
jgi:hypothetical protein